MHLHEAKLRASNPTFIILNCGANSSGTAQSLACRSAGTGNAVRFRAFSKVSRSNAEAVAHGAPWDSDVQQASIRCLAGVALG